MTGQRKVQKRVPLGVTKRKERPFGVQKGTQKRTKARFRCHKTDPKGHESDTKFGSNFTLTREGPSEKGKSGVKVS
jgi:hypothetical protein